jgi:hypothetical protein
MTTDITMTAPADPPATSPPPRDWLALFHKARGYGPWLDAPRRRRLRRVRARAAVALELASDPAAVRLAERAVDLEFARHARGAIAAALIERDGGIEAKVAWLAPGLIATSPYKTALDLARRRALEAHRRRLLGPGEAAEVLEAAAQAELAGVEAAEAAWVDHQARDLVRRATTGDVQACFQVFARDVAEALAGPAATACAYLADLEDHGDDG